MSRIQGVPLLELTRFDAGFEAEIKEAFERVLHSGRYILGPEVDALEKECAEYVGAREAIGVTSGSDALLVSLMALDIGPGDEVICPTYTFFATAGSIWRTGARPVFVDIEPETYNCDPREVALKITPRTRAVIPVHLYGQCAEMEPILEVTRERRIPVIEDAAQAIGSEYRGKRAGSLGALGCFSFFPTKNLGALGDAGLVTTDDAELAEKIRILRMHGGSTKYHHGVVGGNFRLDALQAAFLRVKLKRLDQATRARQDNAGLYDSLLTEADLVARGPVAESGEKPITLPIAPQTRHIFNQYIIRVNEEGVRDRLRDFLTERSIATGIYYPIPLHLQPCFESLGHRPGDFPISEKAADETLALPIFPELTEEEIRHVAGQIAAFFS